MRRGSGVYDGLFHSHAGAQAHKSGFRKTITHSVQTPVMAYCPALGVNKTKYGGKIVNKMMN